MKGTEIFVFNRVAAMILAAFACLAMMLWPEAAVAAAGDGVALWSGTVLPALLPFFICSNFMISLGVPELAARAFRRPFSSMFRAPGSGAFIFLISVMSGYPMGAGLIGDLRRRGELTAAEARRLLAFCSTSGPLFMLGAVGTGLLHSPAAGALIAGAHYGGALLNGLLWARMPEEEGRSRRRAAGGSGPERESREGRKPGRARESGAQGRRELTLLDAFTGAILSSLKTLGIICCYIVVFTMLVDLLELLGCFAPFAALPWAKGLLKGLLEMTVGSAALASAELSMAAKAVLCSFLVSFGGLSVMAQSMSLLSGSGVTAGAYLRRKLSHGLLSAGLALLLAGPVLGPAAAETGLFPSLAAEYQLDFFRQLLFSTEMIIIVMAVLVLTVLWGERKKRHEGGRDHSGI
ncbi:MAG: hypothetical protein Q4C22_04660 [Bacillota bacterium]|nr:hypothetical protein [Bacillota bacterium]